MNHPVIITQTQEDEDIPAVPIWKSQTHQFLKSNENKTEAVVFVREHTRSRHKLAKISSKEVIDKKKQSAKTSSKEIIGKKEQSMDPASFSEIIRIQSQQMAEFKAKKVLGVSDIKRTLRWNQFWGEATAKRRQQKSRPIYVWQKKQNDAAKREKKKIDAINDLSKPMMD